MDTTTATKTPTTDGKKKSLFATAKKETTGSSKAKDEKLVIILTEKEYAGISANLERLDSLRLQIKEFTAEAKMLEGIIKPIARRKFLEQYEKEKKRPESFILKGEKGGSFMVLLIDEYPKIDEARYEELQSRYGGDLVEKNTTYSFDAVLLQKHEQTLSQLIESCPGIPDEDKANLFVAKEEYSIRKGAIDKLNNYGEKLPEVFGAIEPVMQLKNTGNKKEGK